MILLPALVGFTVVALAFLFNYFRAQLHKYRDINKLPGPPALKLLWEAVSTKSHYEKYQFVSNLNKQYGSVLKLWIKPFKPDIMVADVDFVDKILMSKYHLTKGETSGLFKPYLGDGVATTNEMDLWKKSRKICGIAFQHNTIAGLLPIFTKHTNKFLESLKSKTETPIETQHLMHLFSLDMVFESLTKKIYNFQENNNMVYLNARIDFFDILAKRIYSIFYANDLFFRFSSQFAIMTKALHIIRNFTLDIVQSKEREMENEIIEDSKVHFIDIMYANNVHGKILSDQINTFILAAHDTIAQTACYTLHELSKHKEIQQKLFNEIVSFVGEELEITHADLQNMKYLEAVVKEVTRMHPAVPIIERISGRDININGINYPTGTKFVFNFRGIHYSEKYFQHPEKFDPDRFMPENAHLIRKNAFGAFSIGPRDCIGKLYGLTAVKYIAAKIIQKFEVLPVEKHELKIVNAVITKSINGILVILKERLTKCNSEAM